MATSLSGTAGINVDWGAVGVALVIGALAGRSIVRALRAPSVVYASWDDRPKRLRATIEGDYVVPKLGALIEEVNEEALLSGTGDAEQSLQGVDYLDRLKQLSDYYADYNDAARLPDEIKKWIRWKGVAALVFLIGFAQLAFLVAVTGSEFPDFLRLSGSALALIGLTVWTVTSLLEYSAGNRLSDILERYG